MRYYRKIAYRGFAFLIVGERLGRSHPFPDSEKTFEWHAAQYRKNSAYD
jgi:hypothetical protein